MRVSSVLIVEQSKGGLMAKELRSTMKILSPMMGFTLKIVENAGSSLGAIFSNKIPWPGQKCEAYATCAASVRRQWRTARDKLSCTNPCARSAIQASRSQGHLWKIRGRLPQFM